MLEVSNIFQLSATVLYIGLFIYCQSWLVSLQLSKMFDSCGEAITDGSFVDQRGCPCAHESQASDNSELFLWWTLWTWVFGDFGAPRIEYSIFLCNDHYTIIHQEASLTTAALQEIKLQQQPPQQWNPQRQWQAASGHTCNELCKTRNLQTATSTIATQ